MHIQADLEYDFIGEDISKDFFCPVSLELLLHLPQLTECCGNHLSHPVVERLKRDRKPCPLCNEPNLVTHNDKYFERKVRELRVRCPYKDKGCVWEGGVASYVTHASSCPKQPWICQHCKFTSTLEVVASEHAPTCLRRPEPCPNQCEVTFVPHCDMEMHLSQCPLQPVVCTFEEAGCKVKVLRKDLPHHLEEGAQEHMLSALLNLRLTREFQQQLKEKEKEILERDHQLKEKDKQLKEKDHQLKEKDHQLKEKDHQLKEKDQQLKEKDQQLKEKDKQLDEQFKEMDAQLKEKDKQLKDKDGQLHKQSDGVIAKLKGGFANLHADLGCVHQVLLKGYEKHDIVLRKFSKYSSEGGNWFNASFYVHGDEGHRIMLNIDVRTGEDDDDVDIIYSDSDSNLNYDSKSDEVDSSSLSDDAENSAEELGVEVVAADVGCESGDENVHESNEEENKATYFYAYVIAVKCGEEEWPINISCYLQLLNQCGDYGHLEISHMDTKLNDDVNYSRISNRILLKDLTHNPELNTMYLKEDRLHFRLYIKKID